MILGGNWRFQQVNLDKIAIYTRYYGVKTQLTLDIRDLKWCWPFFIFLENRIAWKCWRGGNLEFCGDGSIEEYDSCSSNQIFIYSGIRFTPNFAYIMRLMQRIKVKIFSSMSLNFIADNVNLHWHNINQIYTLGINVVSGCWIYLFTFFNNQILVHLLWTKYTSFQHVWQDTTQHWVIPANHNMLYNMPSHHRVGDQNCSLLQF